MEEPSSYEEQRMQDLIFENRVMQEQLRQSNKRTPPQTEIQCHSGQPQSQEMTKGQRRMVFEASDLRRYSPQPVRIVRTQSIASMPAEH